MSMYGIQASDRETLNWKSRSLSFFSEFNDFDYSSHTIGIIFEYNVSKILLEFVLLDSKLLLQSEGHRLIEIPFQAKGADTVW